MSLSESDVRSLLAFFGESLRKNDADGLKELFSEEAKLSEKENKKLGAENVAKWLMQQNSEFTPESFAYLAASDGHFVITGTCTWRSHRNSFSIILEPGAGSDGYTKLTISSLIILPLNK